VPDYSKKSVLVTELLDREGLLINIDYLGEKIGVSERLNCAF
jgi:hypothetical protein